VSTRGGGGEGGKLEALWSFIDETEFTQEPDQSGIFELAQEFCLESVCGTRTRGDEM